MARGSCNGQRELQVAPGELQGRAAMTSLCGERRERGERDEPAWPGCRPCGSQRRDCGTPLLGRRAVSLGAC